MTETTIEVEGDLSDRVAPLRLTAGRHNRVVVNRPRLQRPHHTPLVGRAGSSLVSPGPWNDHLHVTPFVLSAVARQQELEAGVVFVIGHATSDEAGDLALSRADVVQHLVADDRSAWVDTVAAHGSLGSVLGVLDHLSRHRGWSCPPGEFSDDESPATKSAVGAFQAEYNQRFDASIHEDGVCGRQTLGAVFDVLRDEWHAWVAERQLDDATIDAADIRYLGADPAAPDTPRRGVVGGAPGLDIFVVDATAVPDDVTAEMIYGSRLARDERYSVHWHFTHDVLVVRVDLRGAPDGRVPTAVRLRNANESFDETMELPQTTGGETFVDCVFEDVPCKDSYTVSLVHEGGGPEEIIVADAPYDSLVDGDLPEGP